MPPETTLLFEDVALGKRKVDGNTVEVLTVKLKSPKESRGRWTEVDLYENKGKSCPIRSYKIWQRVRQEKGRSGYPLFWKDGGELMTGKDLNLLLKNAFPEFSEGRKFISTHSFRAGLPSEMARLGYEDSEIQFQGRWTSDAYTAYIRLGRNQRWLKQWRLSKAMAC